MEFANATTTAKHLTDFATGIRPIEFEVLGLHIGNLDLGETIVSRERLIRASENHGGRTMRSQPLSLSSQFELREAWSRSSVSPVTGRAAIT